MSVVIQPLEPIGSPHFAGRVEGIDPREPLNADQVAAIERGMDEFAVLVFRGHAVDDDQQLAFASHFGPVEAYESVVRSAAQKRTRLVDVSYLDENGQPLAAHDRRRLLLVANRLWHTDSSFRDVPARYSILSARVVPPQGGNTEFADMRAAWDALDEATQQQLRGLTVQHSLLYSRAKLGFTDFSEKDLKALPPARHALVRRHPVTGRLSLYLSSHAGQIEGMGLPDSLALLMDLCEHATARRFVYAHVWQAGDLVMWDNRTTMHRVRPFDESQVRDLRRVTTMAAAPAPGLPQAA